MTDRYDGQQKSSSPQATTLSPSRKRKQTIPPNATLIWARDGDHDGAKEHPAYILSSPPQQSLELSSVGGDGCRENNDSKHVDGNDEGEECVWVQWASNGTVSRIPKSNLSSGLPSRRSRRSSASASPNENTPKPKRSRLSLTKKQRRQIKEHRNKPVNNGRKKSSQKRPPQYSEASSSATEQNSTKNPSSKEHQHQHQTGRKKNHNEEEKQTRIIHSHHQIKHSEAVSRVSLSPSEMTNNSNHTTKPSVNLEAAHSFSKHKLQQQSMQNRPEVEIIDIIDSDDEEGEEKKEDAEGTSSCHKKDESDCDIDKTNETNFPEVSCQNELELKLSHNANDLSSKIEANKAPTVMPRQTSREQLKKQLPVSLEQPKSLSSDRPNYTHRSSAYVQHLAEACTLIMTDARWHTACKTAQGLPQLHGSGGCQVTALFSWERGDDLSAVKAFMSLYGEATHNSEAEAENDDGERKGIGPKPKNDTDLKEQDEVFERAMHLYSRMFHRKGPWFDLADLYVRYYAPKPAREHVEESLEQEEEMPRSSSKAVSDSGIDEEAAKGEEADVKVKRFFTPRSSQAKGRSAEFFAEKNSNVSNRSNELLSHQTSMGQLFHDIHRLLSMGLIRSFQSEYEGGLVAGGVTSNRRGILLSAEERREVLRRLGGGKSPKAARAAAAANSKGISAPPSRNEILNQMQSQQSVLSSFAQTPRGGGKAKASMLPVIKHIDKVLIGKLAVKVATLISDAPRKSEVEEATQMVHDAWAATFTCQDNDTLNIKGTASTFRLREAPLKTLRRCMRLFLCAGGGPGAMRGDGTNGWISVLDDEASSSASSSWHNVSYPGLASSFGLEFYEFRRCYAPISLTPQSMPEVVEERNNASSISSTAAVASTASVFTRYCEFQLWEMGVEMRSFIDQATEAYDIEKMIRRRREKELSKLGNDECEAEMAQGESIDGKNGTIHLFTCDGFELLSKQGREKLLRRLMIPCFDEGQLSKHTTLELATSDLCHQIEGDIVSLLNATDDHENDGFISDTERIMAAKAVICHRILQLRVKCPSMMLLSLPQRPWLRHMCFDAILTYILWDCVPIFERRGHHLMAVSILQTILFGQDLYGYRQSKSSDGNFSEMMSDELRMDSAKILAVKCLLPRRNRGKSCERLVIDMAHAERRYRKASQQKPKQRKSSSNDKDKVNEEEKLSPIQKLCRALLSNEETFGTLPFCSLRNLARRSKAPLPQTDERSILKIRPESQDDNDWSPTTDCTVANAIVSDSDACAVGKRCAFVGWEIDDSQGETTKAKRSLNVEELAMEEYHFGRLPLETEEGKGRWIGWHNEGGHVRALFRCCLQHLLESCSHDNLCLNEHKTIFLTPYQSSPHDLHVGSFILDLQSGSPIRGFYERRRPAIESFLSSLTQMDECAVSDLVYKAIKKRWDRHVDDRSRLKDPRLLKDATELKTLSMVAGALGPAALARIFRTLCFDYRHWSGGLPDLLLVRARYAATPGGANSDSLFVGLADWIGEGFSEVIIEEKEIQGHINMLIDRDDEFLGCSKNADGSSSQQQRSARKKKDTLDLPSFPDKLDFMHDQKKVRADCMFVEVKSANDRLSERQEDWLSILENCTSARVCKFVNSSNR
ncbi:hypothetical protein ACHAXR_010769 [Thalassiosira sp. AJA248-18]